MPDWVSRGTEAGVAPQGRGGRELLQDPAGIYIQVRVLVLAGPFRLRCLLREYRDGKDDPGGGNGNETPGYNDETPPFAHCWMPGDCYRDGDRRDYSKADMPSDSETSARDRHAGEPRRQSEAHVEGQAIGFIEKYDPKLTQAPTIQDLNYWG